MARVGQHEPIDIEWLPFELRPEGVPTLDPQGDYITKAWRDSVYPMSEQMGIKMVLPPVQPRTRLAHEAAAYARQVGKAAEMADALFKAFFQEGRDIGQIEVLCDIALSVGIDPVTVRECLEKRTLADQVDQELQLSQQYGITAVPTFIVGNRFMLRGLVSEEHLQRAIAMCRAEELLQIDESD